MKNFILNYLQEHGDVLPDTLTAAVQAAGFAAKGRYEIAAGKHVLVECVSLQFADVLQLLIQSHQVVVKPIHPIEYLFESESWSNNKALLPIRLADPRTWF